MTFEKSIDEKIEELEEELFELKKEKLLKEADSKIKSVQTKLKEIETKVYDILSEMETIANETGVGFTLILDYVRVDYKGSPDKFKEFVLGDLVNKTKNLNEDEDEDEDYETIDQIYDLAHSFGVKLGYNGEGWSRSSYEC